jgi:hypothetical protein
MYFVNVVLTDWFHALPTLSLLPEEERLGDGEVPVENVPRSELVRMGQAAAVELKLEERAAGPAFAAFAKHLSRARLDVGRVLREWKLVR